MKIKNKYIIYNLYNLIIIILIISILGVIIKHFILGYFELISTYSSLNIRLFFWLLFLIVFSYFPIIINYISDKLIISKEKIRLLKTKETDKLMSEKKNSVIGLIFNLILLFIELLLLYYSALGYSELMLIYESSPNIQTFFTLIYVVIGISILKYYILIIDYIRKKTNK